MVDLVGEDSQGQRLVDGLVEADEQLEQGLSFSALQHGQGVVVLGGNRYAPDGFHHAHGNLAVVNQLGDVGQGERRGAGRSSSSIFLCAAGWFTGDALATVFHGRSSSMRLMGWSAMRASTSRR